MVSGRDLADALAEQLDLPLASAADYPELPLMEERLSSKFLRDAQAVPLREDDEELALAIADPTDSFVLNAVQMRSEERRIGKECRSRWARDQAEDGIRDWSVTGVQTCALPICRAARPAARIRGRLSGAAAHGRAALVQVPARRSGGAAARGRRRARARDRRSHRLLRSQRGSDEIGRASYRERV